MMLAISERVEQATGKKGLDKIKEVLDNTSTPGRRKAVDMTLRNFSSEMMKEVYTEANSLPDIPTVQQLTNLKNNAAYSARLLNKDLDVHHNVPKYLLRRLLQITHNDWTDQLLDEALATLADQMPGMLIHKKDHVGIDAEGIASFHNRLITHAELPPQPASTPPALRYTREQILGGLQETYSDNEWKRPEVWTWSKQWLQQQGIDTSGF